MLPLLIHGDAALAGQGIVAETLNFSQLPGYRTGGTLHFVINNQIGFTTDPGDARSTPVLHRRGEDDRGAHFPRQRRRPGGGLHGRAAGPGLPGAAGSATSSSTWSASAATATTRPTSPRSPSPSSTARSPPIPRSRRSTRPSSSRGGSLTAAKGERSRRSTRPPSRRTWPRPRPARPARRPGGPSRATPSRVRPRSSSPTTPTPRSPTGVDAAEIAKIVQGLTTVPDEFKLNPKIKRFLDARVQAHRNGGPIDWGFGEALAFGSLLLEGAPIRLSGQDCERGTFSHRHAVLADVETGEKYTPLKHLDGQQARFCVYNSLLSEAAVLGFDYGYSLDYPEMLCLWEAQFGDFANGAQVVIDQFIVSGESKWQRTCGIVLLLPHGYEGQGPEHSSARLERFLQSCAEDNIQVANLTTPAQYFHVAAPADEARFPQAAGHDVAEVAPAPPGRRLAAWRISPAAPSRRSSTIPTWAQADRAAAQRLILCSGKVYYDLCDQRAQRPARRRGHRAGRAALPAPPGAPARDWRRQYAEARLVWCQEESQNMGAWSWIAPQLEADVRPQAGLRRPRRLVLAGRRRPRPPPPGAGGAPQRRLHPLTRRASAFLPHASPRSQNSADGRIDHLRHPRQVARAGRRPRQEGPAALRARDRQDHLRGPAEAAGKISLKVAAGAEVKIGQVVAAIDADARGPPAGPPAAGRSRSRPRRHPPRAETAVPGRAPARRRDRDRPGRRPGHRQGRARDQGRHARRRRHAAPPRRQPPRPPAPAAAPPAAARPSGRPAGS